MEGNGDMLVNSATSGTTPVASASSTNTPTVDYDRFLQLLITEMQDQDPTAPTDPTQYMSQLASFSSVEEGVQANTTLNSMLTSSSLSQADQVLGKTVTSADGTTTGTVVSATVGQSGVTVTLDSGAQVLLSSGVSID